MVRSRVISHLTAETISTRRRIYLIQPRFPFTWVIIFYAMRWSYLPVNWSIDIRYWPLAALSRHFVSLKINVLHMINFTAEGHFDVASVVVCEHCIHTLVEFTSRTTISDIQMWRQHHCVNILILSNACHGRGSWHITSKFRFQCRVAAWLHCGSSQFRSVSRSRSCCNAITMMPDSQIGSDPVRVPVGGAEVHWLSNAFLFDAESTTRLPNRTIWILSGNHVTTKCSRFAWRDLTVPLHRLCLVIEFLPYRFSIILFRCVMPGCATESACNCGEVIVCNGTGTGAPRVVWDEFH